jgi:uncharacterized protein (DUF2267 family)
MALQFNKYAEEGNQFVNKLAFELGHPEEKSRTGIVLRSVLHTLRDRITVSESLNLISQFPMFLKAIYVDNWKYLESPLQYSTIDEFSKEVENHQERYGEHDFDWKKSTTEIIQIVLGEMSQYISRGEAESIISQLPAELKDLVRESTGV